MIEQAARRNADHVAAGRASFQAASLRQADLGDARFDKVFAIHVGVLLRGQPARELEIIQDRLAAGVGPQPRRCGPIEPQTARMPSILL